MKTIFLARHAEAQSENSGCADFDRTLTDRGRADAARIGACLQNLNSRADLVISSPACRAISTAQIIAEKIKYPLADIDIRRDIYEAWPEDIIEIVRTIDERVSTAFLFGHNPAVSQVAIQSNGAPQIYIEPAGVVQITLNIHSWNEFIPEKGEFVDYFSPINVLSR